MRNESSGSKIDLKKTFISNAVNHRRQREQLRRRGQRKKKLFEQRNIPQLPQPQSDLNINRLISNIIRIGSSDDSNIANHFNEEKSRLYSAFILNNIGGVIYALEGNTGSSNTQTVFFETLFKLGESFIDFIFPIVCFFNQRSSELTSHVQRDQSYLPRTLHTVLDKSNHFPPGSQLKILIPSAVCSILYHITKEMHPDASFLQGIMPIVDKILLSMEYACETVLFSSQANQQQEEQTLDLFLNGLELFYDLINQCFVSKSKIAFTFIESKIIPFLCKIVEREPDDRSDITSEAVWLFEIYNKYFYSENGFHWIRNTLLSKCASKTDDLLSFFVVMRHISEKSKGRNGPSPQEQQLYAQRVAPVIFNYRKHDIYVVEICLQILFNWGVFLLDERTLYHVLKILRFNLRRDSQMVCVCIMYLSVAMKKKIGEMTMMQSIFLDTQKTQIYISAFTDFFKSNMHGLSPSQATICLQFIFSLGLFINNTLSQNNNDNSKQIAISGLRDNAVPMLVQMFAQKLEEERSFYANFPNCEYLLDKTITLYTKHLGL